MTAQHPGRTPGRPKGSVARVSTRGSTARAGDSARVTRTIGTYGTAGRNTSNIVGNYSQKCSVCNSKYLQEIHELLLLGRGYKMILEAIPELNDPDSRWHLTPTMLRHHVRSNHLPLREIAIQTIYSERMEALGKAIEDHTGIVTDQVVLGRLIMDRYLTHLVKNPNWVPETAAVVSVMKMFADAEKEGRQSIDTTVYNQVLGVLIEVVRSVVPDHFDEIMHRVGNNPVVLAILRQQQQQAELPSA